MENVTSLNDFNYMSSQTIAEEQHIWMEKL